MFYYWGHRTDTFKLWMFWWLLLERDALSFNDDLLLKQQKSVCCGVRSAESWTSQTVSTTNHVSCFSLIPSLDVSHLFVLPSFFSVFYESVCVCLTCVTVPFGEGVERSFGLRRPVGGAGAKGAGGQRLAQVVWAHLLRVVGGRLTPVCTNKSINELKCSDPSVLSSFTST